MCGIVGHLNFDGKPVNMSLVKRMTDEISHRGPDGEGHWYKGEVGFGHRGWQLLIYLRRQINR